MPAAEGINFRYTTNTFVEIFRSLVTLTRMIVLVLQLIHAFLSYNLGVEIGKIKNGSNFFKTRYFRSMIAEMILILPHCPPGLNVTFFTSQLGYFSYDTILTTWGLLRSYLAFRLFAQIS